MKTMKNKHAKNLKLPGRICDCSFCKTCREITRIGKLLPKSDAVILDGLFDAVMNENEVLQMDLSWAESRIVDIYIAAARAHNKYDPQKSKEDLEKDACARRTKPKGTQPT